MSLEWDCGRGSDKKGSGISHGGLRGMTGGTVSISAVEEVEEY